MEEKTPTSTSTPEDLVHKTADPNPAQPDVFAAGPGNAAPTPFNAKSQVKIIGICLLGIVGFIGLVMLLT